MLPVATTTVVNFHPAAIFGLKSRYGLSYRIAVQVFLRFYRFFSGQAGNQDILLPCFLHGSGYFNHLFSLLSRSIYNLCCPLPQSAVVVQLCKAEVLKRFIFSCNIARRTLQLPRPAPAVESVGFSLYPSFSPARKVQKDY